MVVATRATRKPSDAKHRAKCGSSPCRSGKRKRAGTPMSPRTTPALAVKTMSGSPVWEGIESIYAHRPLQDRDEAVPLRVGERPVDVADVAAHPGIDDVVDAEVVGWAHEKARHGLIIGARGRKTRARVACRPVAAGCSRPAWASRSSIRPPPARTSPATYGFRGDSTIILFPPLAQWIEPSPSKRVVARSSRAGRAKLSGEDALQNRGKIVYSRPSKGEGGVDWRG